MKQLILLLTAVTFFTTGFAQSNYTVFGGNNGDFNAKYKIGVVFNEQTGILTVSGNAPVMNVMLTGYTTSQYAVRKGSEHAKYFPTKVRKFSYDMKVPGLKDRYCYWLKVYAENGMLQEYIYKRKTGAPAVDEKAQEAEGIATVDETEASSYEFYDQSNRDRVSGKTGPASTQPGTVIKTNITCLAGKKKVTDVLMKMDGVTRVMIDMKTGKITLFYSTDGTAYTTIIETINENGFSADGKPAKAGTNNPCAGKN